MTDETSGSGSLHAGRTTIRPQAVRRLAEAVAADVSGIPARRVNAALIDERGELAVRVTTPVVLGSGVLAVGTLVDCAGELAEAVVVRLHDLAGRSVGRVDVRITGAYRSDERRVL